ncbi:hypothetical protein GCM10012289_41090 [Nonomuraea cavernae]|uniref:Uncharacterized protein n=1 Tax=Nonomuraea cavernae TaxID=2045107 RepID=A0A918DLJ7_9ACTN|nr:hypothetical protein GCM10012289_41090 [Nonomuraea cavernae]
MSKRSRGRRTLTIGRPPASARESPTVPPPGEVTRTPMPGRLWPELVRPDGTIVEGFIPLGVVPQQDGL